MKFKNYSRNYTGGFNMISKEEFTINGVTSNFIIEYHDNRTTTISFNGEVITTENKIFADDELIAAAEKFMIAPLPCVNNTNIKLGKKWLDMLELIEKDEDGYWAYSKDGYQFKGMGGACHTAHEDRVKDLKEMIRTLIPCDCDICREAK